MNPLTNVKIKLVGEDGNSFYILGKVKKELRRNGYDKDFINQFMEEATAGDYDNLLQTVMKYVIVE